MAGEIEVGRAAVRLILDDSSFWKDVARLSSATVKDIKIQADADTAKARAELKSLQDETNQTSRDNDTLSRSFGAITGGLGELASGLRNISTLIKAARIPFLLAGLGAIPAIASAAAVAVGQLALGLSQGIAGGAVVVGTAVGGMVAGLRAYTSIATNVVTSSLETAKVIGMMVDKYGSLHEYLKVVNPEARASVVAMYRFGQTVEDAQAALILFREGLSVPILRGFTEIIKIAIGRLDDMEGIAMRLSRGVTQVAVSFVKALNEGQRFAMLRRTLGFVASSGIRAAQIAKQLGLALLAAIQPVLPLSARLQRTMVGLSRSLRQWAESARGQRQIASFFQNAWRRAQQLWRIVVNLGKGFRNLFSIIAPGTNNMMKSLENLSRSFSQVGARGTESRRKIQQFVNQSKPILAALGNLVGTLVREFFKLAGNVAKMQQGAKHVNTLAGAINGLAKAIPPVRRLLQQTFEQLGPTIGPLVKQVARFFQVFAGSTDVLVRVVSVMTQLLKAFNKLPGPIKNVVANLVALRVVSKLLGVSILVKLAASVGRVSAGLVGFAGKSAIARASASRLLGAFKFLATGVAARLLGPGALIDIVARATVEIMGRWDWLRDRVIDFANWLKGTWAGGLINFFRNLPSSLTSAIAQGIKGVGIFGPIIAEAEKLVPRLKKLWGIHSPSRIFRGIGNNLMDGFVGGMRDKFKDVDNHSRKLADNPMRIVRKLLRIGSPSGVFRQYGMHIGEGMVMGIRQMLGQVQAAAAAMARAAVPPGFKMAEDGSLVPSSFYRGGRTRAEDGSLVPRNFYNNRTVARPSGMVRAEDGSLVPRSFYSNSTNHHHNLNFSINGGSLTQTEAKVHEGVRRHFQNLRRGGTDARLWGGAV